MKSSPLKEAILGKKFFVPKNLNFWYVFGALLLVALTMQYLSGLCLVMFYQPNPKEAFSSIQYLIREIHFGWLIHDVHTLGASAIFALLYLHLIRSLLYRSYRAPRQWVWYVGVMLFLCMMAEAFCGYLLPWGQMSYWGITVVTNLLSAFPHSAAVINWIRGDYQISDVTLTRFYAIHIVALPIIIIFLIQWHIRILHLVGSGNPELLNIETRSLDGNCPQKCIPFFPHQVLKDSLATVIFLIIFCVGLFFMPYNSMLLHEPLNYLPANPLQTPTDIHPLWYLASFYSLLRSVPNKLMGTLLLIFSWFMWFLLPVLDHWFRPKSITLWHKLSLGLWILSWIVLSYTGLQPALNHFSLAWFFLSMCYIFFFLLSAII